MRVKIPRIYPITDKRLARKSSHLEIVRELVRGGAKFIQIRDKETPLGEFLKDLRRCVEFAARFDVRILVNDRCDLALLCGASGVHLGQEDLPPASARLIVGKDSILGFSTHSPAQLKRGARQPVQYLAFGPVFATSSKLDHSPVVGLAMLREACRISPRPVVAIGGIGLDQVRSVLEAGAASAAVISAAMQAESLARRMEQLLQLAGEK